MSLVLTPHFLLPKALSSGYTPAKTGGWDGLD